MFTKRELLAQLKEMQAPQDGVVLMHTSLRCIGEVEGGGEGLLATLIEYFTAEGGLFCVPTHTAGNLLRNAEFALDMESEYNDLGTFPTLALRDGRGIRSENPVLSMVVFGDREKAMEFVKDEAFTTTPTAPEGCYGKLADWNGHVLLVGVGQERNTFLHCVAEILQLPDRMDDKILPVKVRYPDGRVTDRVVRMYECSSTNDVSLRFPKYETAFRYHRCIRDGFLGNAPVRLCDAAKMRDVVRLIFQNAEGKDPLATEAAIPPTWFCNKR